MFQDAFYKIGSKEGVTSLWSGLSPTLVLALPATVIYFVCYEQLRIKYKEFYFSRNPGTLSINMNYIAYSNLIW